jgi:hypothetical protein
MTFDEAYAAACRLLDERGQLLNAHLFRLVASDKELFREVRDQLIRSGVAEDRSAAGLIKVERQLPSADDVKGVSTDEPTEASQTVSAGSKQLPTPLVASDDSSDWVLKPEWWHMSDGVARGPMSLVTLCEMRQRGQFQLADVVRLGDRGPWQNPDEVPLLAASTPNVATAKRSIETPRSRESFVPSGKSWQIDVAANRSPFVHAWNVCAGMVGGSRRLKLLLSVALFIGMVTYWWQLPPSASTIYREFATCRTVFQRLQNRHAKRADWDEATARYRPRMKYLLSRLKPLATEKHPIQNALYQAGLYGILPVIDGPGSFNDPDPNFDKNMKRARDLLDGLSP